MQRGGQDGVEAGHMEERHNQHVHVIGPEAVPSDGGLHVEEDVAVGDHSALGETGGAGGVDDGGDVIGAEVGEREVLSPIAREVLDRHDALGVQLDADQGVHGGKVGDDLGDRRPRALVGDDDVRACILEDELHLLGFQADVDRHGHSARADDTHVADDRVNAVRHHQRDPGARPYVEPRAQVAREALDQPRQVRVRERVAAIHRGDSLAVLG